MNIIKIPKGLNQPHEKFFNRICGPQSGVKAQGERTEITLYDELGGFGVTAKTFRSWLNGAGDILLRINSPGGNTFEGIAIYNDLLTHKGRIDVEISGVAASAASVVAMAGDSIKIAKNAFIMIHNSWGLTIGNKNDHEKMRDILSRVDNEIAGTYSDRANLDKGAILSMMDTETWMNGEEAVERGFADEIIEEIEIQARFDLTGKYKNIPQAVNFSDGLSEDEKLILQKLEACLK